MATYTDLGLEKLKQQVENSPKLVRCPRDGVVMRVLGGHARPCDGSDDVRRFNDRLPDLRRWRVIELDVECPACRRRAEGIPSQPNEYEVSA